MDRKRSEAKREKKNRKEEEEEEEEEGRRGEGGGKNGPLPCRSLALSLFLSLRSPGPSSSCRVGSARGKEVWGKAGLCQII